MTITIPRFGSPSRIQVDTERATRHLRPFIQQAWHIVEPATPFVDGWHIGAICEHLEAVTRGQIQNLVINMPPRHMKSLSVSVFWPCWEWTFQPWIKWLFGSYALSLSTRDSVASRIIISSPWYRQRWGHVFSLKKDQNEKKRYENDKRGYRIATSVEGTGTGEGGDRCVADDPHNAQKVESDPMRKAAVDWWFGTMSTRLNDQKTSSKIVVMQRTHVADVTGQILHRQELSARNGDHDADADHYEVLILPAEYEPRTYVTCIGWSDPRTRDGELLWPEKNGPREIAKLKLNLGSYRAAGQLQQRPAPVQGGIFQREWWRFYTVETRPKRFDEIIQSWDMAFKGLDDSDYVAGQAWGRIGADKYWLGRIKKQLDFTETVAAILDWNRPEKWRRASAKLVEDKANGPAIISHLKHKVPGLIAVNPEGGKISRAHAVAPQIEAGNVYLPHPEWQPWVAQFIEDAASFPNIPHDDEIDAMTQALVYLDSGDRKMETF